MDPRRPRAIFINRDDNGYGLTVSGDNPVSVQTIKRGGAAEIAGICEGDIIIKVNGTVVEHMNHTEVVNLIKTAGAYVNLTVRTPDMTGMPGVGIVGNSSGRPHHVPISHERTVTAPLPVDRGIQMQMQDNKFRTLQVYRDQAAAEFEAAWKKYESTQSQRDKREFEKAEKSLRSIEAQMKKFRQSSPNLQLHSPTPFNPYPQSHQSIQFHPYQHHQLQSHFVHGSAFHLITQGSQLRNRNPLNSQSSVPSLFQNQNSWDQDTPPPLPPRSFSQTGPFTSHETNNTQPPDYSPHDPMPHPQVNHGHIINPHPYFQSPNNFNVVSSRSPGPGSAYNSQSHNNQQHHRAKSSPDPISMQKALSSVDEGSKRSDSVNDLSKTSNSSRSHSHSTTPWDSDASRLSPPGSPPPPYGRQNQTTESPSIDENLLFTSINYSGSELSPILSQGGCQGVSNVFSPSDIMSMEEDDCLIFHDSPGISSMGKHGPWSNLTKLLMHNAHLAVFMNFVIGNKCDPSSLLFYLITCLPMEDGTLKEMKRWGYEIHSTFTAPGSPLHVPHVDENIADEIDDSLVRESDKEEMMRRVFRKARNKAKEEINKQLEEFCTKKKAGLGTMFGPPDSQLEECLIDRTKEAKVIETYLIPRFDVFCEEYEKASEDRTLAIINAVSTILQKQFLVRPNSSGANSVLERCGSFVSKEKSVKARFMSKHNKKITHNGHHFSPQFMYSYTVCNICGKILWGVAPQGLQCSDCNIYVHRHCYIKIQDNCVGTEADGQKKKDRLRQIKDKIRSKSDVPKRRGATNPLKRNSDDNFFSNHPGSLDLESGDRPLPNSGNSSSNLKNEKRPDTLSEERTTQDGSTYDDGTHERSNAEPRKSSNIVGRSESCKERPQRKQPRERRKHSDPNLTSKSSDVDLDSHRILSDTNNSSASNSSLSARSSDSPSTSLELVSPHPHHSSPSFLGRNSETPDTREPNINPYRPTQWEGDSDIEVEQDAPDWTRNVPEDILSQLELREKKRQEILNELFHTERSHVRNLKVVDRLFHRPIRTQQLLPLDLIQMLFTSWEDMLEIHGKFNTTLKRKRKENPVIGDIGSLLLEIFDGETAENFKKVAAACCARQQIGLKALKERREKSPKLNAFLQEAEQDPVCRRLQIQDMIPMAMQRLTKYPLMFSKLCHCSDSTETEEYKSIQRALEMSKEILNSVNYSKKEAEDNQRLIEIQGRLDRSSLEKGILSLEKGVDKADINFINELRNLDLTTHKLMHEGPLHWRIKSSKQKSEVLQEVQLVLLNDMVVILLKQDDRFVLKNHTSSSYPGKSERVILRPVIKLNNLIIRANAADKKAFMLINMTSSNMYDLVCSSMEERKLWLHHITKAAEDYKSKQESRRTDFHPANIPHSLEPDATKEVGEVGESGEGSSEVESSNGHNALSLGTSPQEPIPVPDAFNSANDLSPENSISGNVKLATGNDQSQNSSPNTKRKIGEFLRVTEASPLIDPSEVVVTSRDIQFAQPIISPHEELKRLDSSISRALGEKMNLVSYMLHIPLPCISPPDEEESSVPPNFAKDSKELVVACMQQVDKLRKTISEQNISMDGLGIAQEQSSIAAALNSLLNQLMKEISRKDDELEMRRQELHRLREQNHGLQERFHSASQESIDASVQINSPAIVNSSSSRPTSSSFIASPSEHYDNEVVTGKLPSKLQSSATTSCECCSSDHPFEPAELFPTNINQNHLHLLACDLAPEDFADALDDLDPDLQLEKQSAGKLHSEGESEEFCMDASTLTLVPENADEQIEEEYGNVGRRNSESPNGHDFANIVLKENRCTKSADVSAFKDNVTES